MEVDDVDGTYKELKKKGVKFVAEPKDQYWGGRTATFIDPDEYRFILAKIKWSPNFYMLIRKTHNPENEKT